MPDGMPRPENKIHCSIKTTLNPVGLINVSKRFLAIAVTFAFADTLVSVNKSEGDHNTLLGVEGNKLLGLFNNFSPSTPNRVL
jgi:hypothetical protein